MFYSQMDSVDEKHNQKFLWWPEKCHIGRERNGGLLRGKGRHRDEGVRGEREKE